MRSLVTYCSKSMELAYLQFAPQWKRQFERVYVYSDGELPHVDGVQVLVEFKPDNGWCKGVQRKVEAVKLFTDTHTDDFVFMDADCDINNDISHPFSQYPAADVIVTRMINRNDRSGDASSGILWVRHHNGRLFVKEWAEKALDPKAWKEQRPNKPAADQLVLHDMLLDAFDGLKPYTAAVISERVYNGGAEAGSGDLEGFYASIKKHRPRVIHFKAGWWRDPFIVKTARAHALGVDAL